MMFPEEDRESIKVRLLKNSIPEPNTGCWLWIASCKNKHGYGQISLRHERGKGPRYAHRVSYAVLKGEIADGDMVLHSCDQPYCINPDHLRLGNKVANSLDMMRRNRGRGQFPKGILQPSSRNRPRR